MKYFYCLLLTLIISIPIFSQDFETGTLLKDSTDITGTEIQYELLQNPDVINNMYETTYKIYDTKKKILATIILINNTQERKLSIVEKLDFVTSTKLLDFKDTEIEYIVTNKNELDLSISVNSNYDFIISFADSTKSYPFLHRYRTADDRYFILDKISKLLLRKYKENSQEALIKNAEIKIARYEAQQRAIELQRLKDSTEKVEKEIRQAFVLDSLQTDTVLKRINLLSHDFLTKYRKDSAFVASLKREIKSKITDKIYGELSDINKRGEQYAGIKNKRKKEGEGILVLNSESYYDGVFKNDTFENGNAIIKENNTEYCGEMEQRKFNGQGKLIYTNGDFEIGKFYDGKFENGILKNSGNGLFYFGNFSNGQKNNFSIQTWANGSVIIAEFNGNKITNGFSKELVGEKSVRFYRYLNGIKAESSSQNFYQMAQLLNTEAVAPSIYYNNSASKQQSISEEVALDVAIASKTNIPFYSNEPMLLACEKLFVKYYYDSIKIDEIKKLIIEKQKNANSLPKDKIEEYQDCIYVLDNDENQNRKIGLMVCDGKVGHQLYSGIFKNFTFESGQVFFVLKNKETYVGGFENNKYSGFGESKYFNEYNDLKLGQFESSNFQRGIVRIHDNEWTQYIGYYENGQRNGFGIYNNTRGSKFIGIFENNKLIEGYKSIQEDDMTNVRSYYKIHDAIQERITKEEWQKINSGIESIKYKYMP